MQKYSGSQGQITTINRSSKTISSIVKNSNDLKQQHLPTEGAWCSCEKSAGNTVVVLKNVSLELGRTALRTDRVLVHIGTLVCV